MNSITLPELPVVVGGILDARLLPPFDFSLAPVPPPWGVAPDCRRAFLTLLRSLASKILACSFSLPVKVRVQHTPS